MEYVDLVKAADDLNSELLELLPERTLGKPPSIDGIACKRLWIHFGLNGSDYDTSKGKEMADSFLLSIAHLDDGTKHFKELRQHTLSMGYTYDTYFKKPVKFYASQGYYQIWQHPEFFTAFPEYKHRLEKLPDVMEFILQNQKLITDSYVLFSDLLFIRDRDSKNISVQN